MEEVIKDQYAKGLLTVDFQAMLDMKVCAECNGAKLKKESLNVFLTVTTGAKYNISNLQKMELNDLIAFMDEYRLQNVKDKILLGRITNPLSDRTKTIQDL